MAAVVADEVDAVGDVEEAVYSPVAARLAGQRGMARARQTEACPSGDAQQVKVGITGDLSLNLLHVGIEALHRVAWSMRIDLGLAVDVANNQSAIPAG